MIICRTCDINRLGSKFIKAKPLAVLLWIFIALVLCSLMTVALITLNNPETIS
ncbi:MAG: hypothetical protein K2J26_02160 [Ruminococcus sp.]|nr:hypothetical protein [Ruminococcus sp.]